MPDAKGNEQRHDAERANLTLAGLHGSQPYRLKTIVWLTCGSAWKL